MIVFRTDANPKTGFGHLTRCRALAQALKNQGLVPVMVGPPRDYITAEDENIFFDWIPKPVWETEAEDASFLIRTAHSFQAKWLVLDDYRVNKVYQRSLRARGLQWMQFDTKAEKELWADLVVNANPAAKKEDYLQVLNNPDSRLLLGPRFSILRQEFGQESTKTIRTPPKTILVTFGGGDDRGANEFAISTLLSSTPKETNFVIMSGVTNPNNDSLKDWIEANGQGRVSLSINPKRVAELFNSCDIAVMAGGTSTYEAAACGLPMILIAIAENQISQSKAWSELGAAIYLGEYKETRRSDLSSAIQALVEDPLRLKKMSVLGQDTVKGDGATRVAKAIHHTMDE